MKKQRLDFPQLLEKGRMNPLVLSIMLDQYEFLDTFGGTIGRSHITRGHSAYINIGKDHA